MRTALAALLLSAPTLCACTKANLNRPTSAAAGSALVNSPQPNTPAPDDLQAEKNSLLSGITLTAIGLSSLGMGGFYVGFGGGSCFSQQDCSAQAALPILGALWIAGGIAPLMFGARFLITEGASIPIKAAPAKKSDHSYLNTVRIGPGGFRIQF